jgi:hypothetical protein
MGNGKSAIENRSIQNQQSPMAIPHFGVAYVPAERRCNPKAFQLL